MKLKTRFPKETNALLIHGEQQLAINFSGNSGKILSLPEIIQSRIDYYGKRTTNGFDIISSSTEWCGVDHNNDLIVARSDNYELFKLVHTNSQNQLIKRDLFLDVLAEKYGKVSTINLSKLHINFACNKNKFTKLKSLSKNASLALRCDLELVKQYLLKFKIIPEYKISIFSTFNCHRYKQIMNEYKLFDENITNNKFIEYAYVHNLVCNKIQDVQFADVRTEISIDSLNKRGFYLTKMDDQVLSLEKNIKSYKQNNYLKHLGKLLTTIPEYKLYGRGEISLFNGYYFACNKCNAESLLANEERYPIYFVRGYNVCGTRTIRLNDNDNATLFEKKIWHNCPYPKANAYIVISISQNLVKLDYVKADIDFTLRVPYENEILSNPKLIGRIV